MNLSFATTGGFLKSAAAAAAVTLSLGTATLATVEPAQAGYDHHGYFHRHAGGFHHYGWGFRHRGFAYRPFHYGYRPFAHRHFVRPFRLIGAPVYGYGYHHHIHRAWGPYAWHHRCI